MQNFISHHTNPMKQKRPFIKKSRGSNLSFISKPNLSITKASHRFSLDRTFNGTDRRHESYIKTARENDNEFTYPEILEELQKPKTARASLQSISKQQFVVSRRRNSLRIDKKNAHKQKLQQILQSIDLNNSIIEELFNHEDEISYFKDEIHRTTSLYEDLQASLKIQVQQKKKKRLVSKEPYFFEQKRKDIENQELCDKITQLRMKRLSFKQKDKSFLAQKRFQKEQN